MNDHEESLCDLDLARVLSRSLSGVRSSPATAAPVADTGNGGGFVRFSAARFLPQPEAPAEPVPAEAMVEPVPVEPAAPEPISFANWEDLLDWCLGQFPAQASFVVEPEGFVIANRGSWSFGHLEGIGPQLLTLSHSARDIEDAGPVKFVALEFEAYWLTGLTARREGMGDFIIAFLGSQPMSGDARRNIYTQVLHNIDHL